MRFPDSVVDRVWLRGNVALQADSFRDAPSWDGSDITEILTVISDDPTRQKLDVLSDSTFQHGCFRVQKDTKPMKSLLLSCSVVFLSASNLSAHESLIQFDLPPTIAATEVSNSPSGKIIQIQLRMSSMKRFLTAR